MQQSIDGLYDMFQPIVGDLGLALIDVEWLPARGGARLAVLIARQGGSVSITDCEDVTRALEHEIETSLAPSQSYVLEVSSPGLERVLKRPHEYEVFQGRTINIWLSEPCYGKLEFMGELQGRQGDTVQLQLPSSDILALPVSLIKKAKLVFKMK